MARVGDEPALMLDGCVETLEHVVKRCREARDLVSARRDRQPGGPVRGDGASAAAQKLDRSKCTGREPIAAEAGSEQCKREEEDELVTEVVE